MSGKTLSLRLATILVPVLSASAANASVTFDSLSIKTSTYATATRGSTTDTHSDSKTTNLAALPASPGGVTSATTAAIKAGGVSRIQVNATSTATAFFQDAASGSFDVTTINSIVQAAASTMANPISGLAKSGAYDFVYNFTVTGSSLFTLDYNLLDPNFLGSTAVKASLTGPLGAFSNDLTQNTSGTITSLLGTGSYALKFHSDFEDEISRTKLAAGTTIGGSLDHFSFSVASVPEPSTWSMMILGFGLIGYTARRAKARPAFNFA